MTESLDELREPHERLRWIREQAGYETATDAASAIGIPYPTYAGHENGTTPMTFAAQRYALFFRVSLDWLVTGRGSPRGRSRVEELYEDLPPEDRGKALEYIELLHSKRAEGKR